MRYFLTIFLLISFSDLSAQRKFGKVRSAEEIFRLCDDNIRDNVKDSIYNQYVRFLPERSKLFIRFDTTYFVETPNGKREEKRSIDISIPFTEVTRYPAPFWAYLWYEVHLPERPDAVAYSFEQIEFTGDTLRNWYQHDVSGVLATIPYSRLHGSFTPSLRYPSALNEAFDTAKNILIRTFGKDVYEKCFSVSKIKSQPTSRLQKDGAFFITPSADTFCIPYSYELYFMVHPVDLPDVGRDFIVALDNKMKERDSAYFHKELADLPECITTGNPSRAMTEKEAITCAIANGVPQAKEKYKNIIYVARKNIEWEIFSVQRSTHHRDGIGHSCDIYYGVYMRLDAITKKVLSGPTDTSYQDGCER